MQNNLVIMANVHQYVSAEIFPDTAESEKDCMCRILIMITCFARKCILLTAKLWEMKYVLFVSKRVGEKIKMKRA